MDDAHQTDFFVTVGPIDVPSARLGDSSRGIHRQPQLRDHRGWADP